VKTELLERSVKAEVKANGKIQSQYNQKENNKKEQKIGFFLREGTTSALAR
jgi:hypothetical protein